MTSACSVQRPNKYPDLANIVLTLPYCIPHRNRAYDVHDQTPDLEQEKTEAVALFERPSSLLRFPSFAFPGSSQIEAMSTSVKFKLDMSTSVKFNSWSKLKESS